MSRDLILYLIVGSVGLFGAALLATAPLAFRREWAKDPDGPARNFAAVVAQPRWSRFALALVVIAMFASEATWTIRDAR